MRSTHTKDEAKSVHFSIIHAARFLYHHHAKSLRLPAYGSRSCNDIIRRNGSACRTYYDLSDLDRTHQLEYM